MGPRHASFFVPWFVIPLPLHWLTLCERIIFENPRLINHDDLSKKRNIRLTIIQKHFYNEASLFLLFQYQDSQNQLRTRGAWSTQAHRSKTMDAATVSCHFFKYLRVFCVKRNFKSSSTFIGRKFFLKVLLICENVSKRSLLLINFSVEICKKYN